MKPILRLTAGLVLGVAIAGAMVLPARIALAQAVGKASADIPNQRPGKGETPWGRLVADVLRGAAKADIAIINAGALRNGTLAAGPVEAPDIDALLSFGDDEAVSMTLSGAQIRAALERAASAYPTASPAFLHVSGVAADFDPGAAAGRRVGPIKVKGRVIGDQDTFAVAMPVSLSEGAAGYFNIWSGAQSRKVGTTLREAITDYIRGKGEVSPDNQQRFGPG